MKIFSVLSLFLAVNLHVYSQQSDVIVSFDKEAGHYVESLPVGNGRLGAMMFGNTRKERIVLNEISLWSGGKQDSDRDSAYQYLKPIQNLLIGVKHEEAQTLLQKHFVAKGDGSGHGRGANAKYGCYQTLGDVSIAWADSLGAVSDYSRTLDLEKAFAVTSFVRRDKRITEELFADFVNDIIWIKLTSSKKGGINVRLSLSRKENAFIKASKNQIIMKGQLPAGGNAGMEFATVLKPYLQDGRLRMEQNELLIENSTSCWIKISSATNYDWINGALKNEDVIQRATGLMAQSERESFSFAAEKSTLFYENFFNRCRWFAPKDKPFITVPTHERLARYSRGESDPQLPVLYFNFGRYLLISSSRPGLLPANLQGLWADEYQTPWNGDYHININLQMNYWPAETTNLGMLAEPLHRFTEMLVSPGKKTAHAYYNAEGWVAHVITNPWLYTSSGEGADWGSTLTGGAWLCEHIWEHYRFTSDTTFLKKYYPVLKGAANLLQSVLIQEPVNGWLVTAPSNSPENTYITDDGFRGQTCMGPAMDMQICRELFNACIKSAEILQTDEEWRKQLQELLPKLAPNRVGKDGGLNEWLDDWKDADPLHRHVAHLYGLHPYDEITPWQTPEFADAARKTLLIRGDGGTGWSKSWKINFWARLGDGDHALQLFRELLKPVQAHSIVMSGGGTYPNLFCAHPPFQIDGNFGARRVSERCLCKVMALIR